MKSWHVRAKIPNFFALHRIAEVPFYRFCNMFSLQKVQNIPFSVETFENISRVYQNFRFYTTIFQNWVLTYTNSIPENAPCIVEALKYFTIVHFRVEKNLRRVDFLWQNRSTIKYSKPTTRANTKLYHSTESVFKRIIFNYTDEMEEYSFASEKTILHYYFTLIVTFILLNFLSVYITKSKKRINYYK